MKKITLFSFSFFQFAAFAFITSFMTVYYQKLGFNGGQIGLLTGLAPLVTLIGTPFWTGLADGTRKHRLILSLTLVGSAITIYSFSLINTFGLMLLIVVLYSIFYSPITSFADSATMFMLADEKQMYGRVRVGGTIGFALAAPLAGVLVDHYGLAIIFPGCAILLLIALIIGQKLDFNQHKAGASARGGVRQLLTNPRWILFLILGISGGLGIAASNTYLFPYLKELGAPESTMGLALTFGTFSEIPVLFFGNRLLRWLKPGGLMAIAMLITGLRLLLFGVATTVEFIFFLQLFNGLTFPAMWMAGVAYADETAPAGLSTTAQGLFGVMVFGVGIAAGNFIGGPILEKLGGHNLYLIFGCIILVALAVVSVLQRILPDPKLPGKPDQPKPA